MNLWRSEVPIHSAEMSSPDYDLVVRSTESIDHSSTPEASNREDENLSLTENYRARILRIDQDEARLTARGCSWYEIKASTLKESDISYVKDKAGITSLYEVVIPHIHARAHRPPAGFHTFYINQIDRGLRFPLPTFIASLCHYIGVSPSQLAPNSYSSLLSLGILLKFHGIPLSTYVLMQLVTIKKLGPGKFYISNKKEFGFVGGNPSSHKGWMSRYFFIRRISGRENFWGCDMSWRDNAHTSPPSPPEQKPNLTKFLEAMRGKCFNAQQLIEEDLLCFFNFSRKKARLVGKLGTALFILSSPYSKGWMSRYFFIRRISGRENFWGCDMSWRDNAHTSPPSPPEQKPNLTKFLEAMRGKCFNAQQLIEEDLLCFFNFSGKKARLIGKLGDRMDKAAMLEALKERRSKTKSGGASSSGAQNKEETSSGAPSKEKREASPEKKERRKKRRHEKRDTGSTQEPIPEVTILEPKDTTNEGPKTKSSEEPYTLLDASKISFVSNPSGFASLDFIRHMVPDQDFDQLKRTTGLEVFESAGLHFMQSLAWFGEAVSRFSKAHVEVVKTKRSYDGVLGRHEVLLKQLEEIQTKENVEKESLTAELESARAEVQTYKAKVQSLEIQVQSLDARAHCAEEESKLRLIEVEKLQEERANSWALEKEKFLKSKDFDSLCLNKAVMYFDKGFEGCLAQFRANGFPEEEYPASFLNVEQALADMPEDQEEDSSGLGENPSA
ncbi:hypothetical protein F511_29726 [Dorcoceras hygrometricum]|uniref:Uncharacterized protein n=1 Tax=Dorcoceras hygrometricum TaxID=472368 RepID=A0A2Z7D6N0_9LAMI|nr:hypothetical protein F511_29726 [Dorcoceras hygrometricum]